MNLRDLRNRLLLYRGLFYPFVILLLLIGLIVALCFSAWWNALVLGAAMVFYGVFNYRAFLLMSKLGEAFHATKQRRYVDAEARLREAWPMAERTAPDDPCRGIVYQDLASVTRILGNFTDAETFGSKAVEAQEKAWGADHTDTILARQELAKTYLAIARYAQAQPLLEQALQAREARHETSIELALCLAMLGNLWAEQDRHADAEPFLRRAFDIMRQLNAQFHPEGLALTLNLANVCARQGKIAEAEALAEGAWDGIHQKTAPAPFEVAGGLFQLAFVRHLQTRYVEAEEMARQALALVRKTMEPNQPAIAEYMNLLGLILSKQGKWDEAEEHCGEALRLREEYLAPEHPLLADSLEIYAGVLEQTKRFHEAEGYARRARQIREFHSPSRSVH